MAFSRKHLFAGEEIVLDLNPHWWYLTPRGAGLAAVSALGVGVLVADVDGTWGTVLGWASAVLIVVMLVAFLVRLIGWRTTNFVVTTDRCIYRSGVLRKTGIEIPLERINTVFFSQNVLERMLRTGDLGIESAGEGSRQHFSDIKNPVQVQNLIYQQMEANENRKYDRIGGEARQAAQAAAPTLSVAEQLEKLSDLRDRGVITDAEFEAQKAQILGT